MSKRKNKSKTDEIISLYVIPEDSYTYETIRRATKEEIKSVYDGIKMAT